MKWRAADIATFQQEKQYIDTVMVSLIPIDWSDDMAQTSRDGEYIGTISYETERQLKGRVVEAPPFTYLKTESMEERMKRLKMWENEIKDSDVKHVFYLTADIDWKTAEESLKNIIITPAVPLEHMDAKHRKDIVEETTGKVIKNLTKAWTESL